MSATGRELWACGATKGQLRAAPTSAAAREGGLRVPPHQPCHHRPCCRPQGAHLLFLRQCLHVFLHAPQQDGAQLLLNRHVSQVAIVGAAVAVTPELGTAEGGMQLCAGCCSGSGAVSKRAAPRCRGSHLQRLDLLGCHAGALVPKLLQKAVLICSGGAATAIECMRLHAQCQRSARRTGQERSALPAWLPALSVLRCHQPGAIPQPQSGPHHGAASAPLSRCSAPSKRSGSSRLRMPNSSRMLF